MKQEMKRIIIIIILFGLCQWAFAYEFDATTPSGHTIRCFSYTTENEHWVAIQKPQYGTIEGDLIIPSTVTYGSNTYIVRQISNYAFANCTAITSITLPSTVKQINFRAFNNCTGLSSFLLPDSVNQVDYEVFSGCTNITTPIYNCTLFVYMPKNHAGAYSIPSGISKVVYGAFEDCIGLTALTLPNSVIEVGGFDGCVNLNTMVYNDNVFAYMPRNFSGSFTIPNGIKYISSGAFKNCTGLASITIPESVKLIWTGAFENCTGLNTLIMNADSLYQDGYAPLWNNLTNVTFGNNVTCIPDALFSYCKLLDSITIPNSVKYIGILAFSNCSRLSYIGLPDSLEKLGDNAFEYDTSLSQLTIPFMLDTIFNNTFFLCSNLNTITLNSRHLKYGKFPTTIEHVVVGDGVEQLSNNAFVDCHIQDMKMLCFTPPTISSSTFASTATNIPIEIPCGAINTYCNAPYWNLFTNYIESDCEQPELCMVGVEDGHNVLYWNREQEVSSYNIYRESVVAGEYELLDSVPYDSISRWVDSTSRPNTRSYRYKISTRDNEGQESMLSHEHKTMHLTINQGLGGRWNLQWTPYEGAEYTTYIIYRGTTANNLEQIDIMPADGNTSYTDETATEGDVFYQVGIVMANGCIETKSASVSLSNIATNSTVGINNSIIGGISTYTLGGQIVVETELKDEIGIYDIVGHKVAGGRKTRFDVPSSGVYFVKLGDYPMRKVVVIK